MTTRKEKFDAARKKTLTQTGREADVVDEEIEVEQTDEDFHGIDISQIPNKADKDRMRNKIQKVHDDFDQDHFDLFDDNGDRKAVRARIKKREDKQAKEAEVEMGLRKSYNFFCWIFYLASWIVTLYFFIYLLGLPRWHQINGLLEHTIVIGFNIIFSAAIWLFSQFVSQILLGFIGCFYARWYFHGKNPESL